MQSIAKETKEDNNNVEEKVTKANRDDTLAAAEKTVEQTDTRCGYTASCKPKCLQRCAHPKVFLLLITLYTMVHGKFSNCLINCFEW